MPLSEVNWSVKNNVSMPTVAAEKSLNITKDQLNTTGNSGGSNSPTGLDGKEPRTITNYVHLDGEAKQRSTASTVTTTEPNDFPTKKRKISV